MPFVDRKGIGGGIVLPFPSQGEKIVIISHRKTFKIKNRNETNIDEREGHDSDKRQERECRKKSDERRDEYVARYPQLCLRALLRGYGRNEQNTI